MGKPNSTDSVQPQNPQSQPLLPVVGNGILVGGLHAQQRSRLLTLFFAMALLLNVGYVLVGLTSIPRYYQRVVSQQIEPVVIAGELQTSNEVMAQAAVGVGFLLRAMRSTRVSSMAYSL